MLPLSVFIITKNEEDRIARAINSVKGFADEVIVIDSGSLDKTVQIADSLGAKVMYHEWRGYGAQKIFGESQCRNDWILNIDADEEVSPELAQEIESRVESRVTSNSNSLDSSHTTLATSAYKIDMVMLLPFEQKPKPLATRLRAIRLYNKKRAGFRDSEIHDAVVVREGKTGLLKAKIYHRSFRGYAHEVEKINFYTSMQGSDMLKKGRKPSALRIATEPFMAFFKAYFLRRYFIYGLDGFIQSCIYAFSKTLRLAKARELFQKSRSD